MFYTYLRTLVMFLLWAVNGNARYHATEKLLKDENYVLVAPHRTVWDPVYLAFAARPKHFVIMAKQELFKNRAFAWWIRMCGAFPVDRANAGAAAIKYPVKMLKKTDRAMLMFPSGSRHSEEVKGGVAVIAKTAKVKILPSAYVGPRTIKGLFRREAVDVIFGDPIDISDIPRLDAAGLAEASQRVEQAFHDLEAQVAAMPARRRPGLWTYLYRGPVMLLVFVLLAVTYLASWGASFIIDPEKTL